MLGLGGECVNIKIKEYESLKRQVYNELESVKREILDMFYGVMFDNSIYVDFDSVDRMRYSQLRQIMDNLNGQLDTFKRLEGCDNTELNKLLRWKELSNDKRRT